MLYLVGLGLSDETDITIKGLEIVKRASRVYLEAYTSILLVEKEVLVSFFWISFICQVDVFLVFLGSGD
jgi:diphthine synthase